MEILPLEPLAGWLISGPPHRLDIRDRTENAILAVGKSSTSLAKCSIVVITVSKIDWFANYRSKNLSASGDLKYDRF